MWSQLDMEKDNWRFEHKLVYPTKVCKLWQTWIHDKTAYNVYYNKYEQNMTNIYRGNN